MLGLVPGRPSWLTPLFYFSLLTFLPLYSSLCLMLFLLALLKDKRDCPSTLRCTSELFFLLRASCMCNYSNDASSTPLVVPKVSNASKLDHFSTYK